MKYLLAGMFGRACKQLDNKAESAKVAAEVGTLRESLVDKLTGRAGGACLLVIGVLGLCVLSCTACGCDDEDVMCCAEGFLLLE